MITHNVKQGSPEWLALRADYDTASEAPAMMGASKYMTREDLLKQKISGVVSTPSKEKQALFDAGHRTEALARVIIERIIGEELYPVTGSLEGTRLLASYDGMDMAETMAIEHKLWNEKLAAAVRANDLPPAYYWQLEQELLVGDLDHILFVVSDGTEDNMERMEYRAVPGRREALLAGWAQFNEDRANFKHQELPVEPVKKAIEQLPALQLHIDGEVVVKSNLPSFMAIVQERVRAIKTDLVTDQDFADAKATVTFLKDGEDKVKMAMDLFLNQSASIAEVKTRVEALLADMRAKRLALDKSVTAQESIIRIKILEQYKLDLDKHLMGLRDSLSQRVDLMPAIPVDFALAMKNKRLLSAIHDSCKQALANAKLAAGDAYTRIQTNMGMMRLNAAGYGFLFQAAADLKAIVNMDPVAAEAVVKQRIAEYDAAEQKKRDDAAAEAQRRNEELLERERGRIREEEQAKAQAEQEASARAAQAAAAPAVQDTPATEAAPNVFQDLAASPGYQATAAVDARLTVVPPSTSPPTMNNGKVCTILGFAVTAEFLVSIGAPAPTKQGNASLWHDRQILDILEALGAHMSKVYAEQKAKYQPAKTRTAA